ncbi:hypothetical protein, partial [Pseudonocardia xishanensis]|uniref:hypothetical protein n=1 Tax=Pseudonocardia xishanensis TaxID=630995 RepID=UPI0031F0DB42
LTMHRSWSYTPPMFGRHALVVGTRRDGGPRSGRSLPLAAVGALAVLAALAVHSGLDFLWHIPAVPLLAVVSVVIATEKEIA